MRMRRRWREGGREGGLRERRVEADTLGNLYNYPQGRPEAVDGQEGGRGWLSVEKAGAHTSIQGTTPRPGLLRHLSELLPPVHHLALAPSCHPTCHPSPLALPSFSRTTFCVPAMLSVLSVYVVVGVKTLRRAGYPQVRCTSNARVLPISFLDCKLSERAVLPDAETIRLVANCTRRTGYV